MSLKSLLLTRHARLFQWHHFVKENIVQLKLNAGFMEPCGGQQTKGDKYTRPMTSLPVYREYQRHRQADMLQQYTKDGEGIHSLQNTSAAKTQHCVSS